MIGNDIIDLSLAKTQSNWLRPGFLEKQFTQQEIESIQNSENPFLLVWRFWSMKEAVYKVVVQQEQRRFFAPKKFECRILSEKDGVVSYQGQQFHTQTTTTRKYIYTSTGKASFQWIGKKRNQEEFLQLLERETGIPSTEIEIKKNALGVPNVYTNGTQISLSFTKTHHGDFEAMEFIK